jgi:hypothetical protein
MAENPDSKDKSLETLDFIINVLKEHEISLDKTIDELSTIVEQIGDTTDELKSKVDGSEEKINNLQKEVANLIGYLSRTPEKALLSEAKQPQPQIQAAPTVSSTVFQGNPALILHCNQWNDFHDLAMHAQKLFFSYKEDEKVFQYQAIVGNQMIIYEGEIPNFSMILKKWLSGQLDILEHDILEGFFEIP